MLLCLVNFQWLLVLFFSFLYSWIYDCSVYVKEDGIELWENILRMLRLDGKDRMLLEVQAKKANCGSQLTPPPFFLPEWNHLDMIHFCYFLHKPLDVEWNSIICYLGYFNAIYNACTNDFFAVRTIFWFCFWFSVSFFSVLFFGHNIIYNFSFSLCRFSFFEFLTYFLCCWLTNFINWLTARSPMSRGFIAKWYKQSFMILSW